MGVASPVGGEAQVGFGQQAVHFGELADEVAQHAGTGSALTREEDGQFTGGLPFLEPDARREVPGGGVGLLAEPLEGVGEEFGQIGGFAFNDEAETVLVADLKIGALPGGQRTEMFPGSGSGGTRRGVVGQTFGELVDACGQRSWVSR